MNRINCYFERISDFAIGLFLLFVGLALTADFSRCIFRSKKKQGMRLDRPSNQGYLFVLTGGIRLYSVCSRSTC